MHSADISGLFLPAEIVLFELSKFNPSDPAEVFRFCNDYGVTFNGNNYQSLGASLESLPIKSEGAIAVAALTINDVQGIFSSLYRQYRVDGATLRTFKTDSRYLNLTNSDKVRSLSIFTVSHAEEIKPKDTIKILLSPRIMDLDRPQGRIMAGFCQATFKDGATCPYGGGQTTCKKTLTDCKSKFGSSVPLPFLGIPAGLSVEQAGGWGS